MSDGAPELAQWARIVDAIMLGERPKRPLVTVGPTPKLLQSLGLETSDMMMATGKIALCRREHPEVSRSVWHALPELLEKPLVVVPSARRDGSQVVVPVVTDTRGEPILVIVQPGSGGGPNIILSIYGKEGGLASPARSNMQHPMDCLILSQKVSPPLCRSRGPQMPSPRHLV